MLTNKTDSTDTIHSMQCKTISLHVSLYANRPCMAAPTLSMACPAVRMAVPRLLTSDAAMFRANSLPYVDVLAAVAVCAIRAKYTLFDKTSLRLTAPHVCTDLIGGCCCALCSAILSQMAASRVIQATLQANVKHIACDEPLFLAGINLRNLMKINTTCKLQEQGRCCTFAPQVRVSGPCVDFSKSCTILLWRSCTTDPLVVL